MLEDFEKKAKHKLSLGKFDEKTFNKFLKFCVENREHSANTVHRNIGLLKTFLLWAFNKKYSFNNSFLNFKKPYKSVSPPMIFFYIFSVFFVMRIIYDIFIRTDINFKNDMQLWLYIFGICMPIVFSVLRSHMKIDLNYNFS